MRTILRRVLSSTCWELSPEKSTWQRRRGAPHHKWDSKCYPNILTPSMRIL